MKVENHVVESTVICAKFVLYVDTSILFSIINSRFPNSAKKYITIKLILFTKFSSDTFSGKSFNSQEQDKKLHNLLAGVYKIVILREIPDFVQSVKTTKKFAWFGCYSMTGIMH
jgi:hypothetical protein